MTKSHLITGLAGQLEVVVEPPRAAVTHHKVVMLICHPHPLYQGSMDNKVVTMTGRAMQALGVTVCRFNFRGIGQSAGCYDNGIGEMEDARTVAAWLRQQYPDSQLWLAGFSFGGYIAYSVANSVGACQLLTLAPAVVRFNASGVETPSMPWLVVQSDSDEIVPYDAVMQWLNTLRCEYTLIKLTGVSHFFHGQLVRLRQLLQDFYLGKLK